MNRAMMLPVSAFSAAELALWSWFVFGAVVITLIPQARGISTIGWLPFWLVVAPLLDLAFVHRGRLLDVSKSFAAQARTPRSRRRPRTASQARHMRRSRAIKPSAAHAAVFEI
ncbi:MAG TPA: hypothetical protein VHW73_02915 [Rudaea sp.]|jgi:hypothetical protein|nr:hypothetical protein [Rudaea sp.]